MTLSHPLLHYLAVPLCWVALQHSALHAIVAARDIDDAAVTISPEWRNKTWTGRSLAPGYTFTFTVNAISTGTVKDVEYVLVGGLRIKSSEKSDPNTIWIPSSNNSNTQGVYSIINTAIDTATASIDIEATWIPKGGKGGGGSGPGPSLLIGIGRAQLSMLDSDIAWRFNKKFALLKDAAIKESIHFDINVTDGNGNGLMNWTLDEFTPAHADPQNPAWTFVRLERNGWNQQAAVLSSTLSNGKIQVKYHDGSVEERTSTGEVTFARVDMITPAGDPVKAPVEAGPMPLLIPNGANEFTFDQATPGILTLKLAARVQKMSGLPLAEQANFTFEVDGIGNSTLAWPGNPGGKALQPLAGEVIAATATYTGLPLNNADFGMKTVHVKHGGLIVAGSNFEVFFPKTANNHPELGPYPGLRPPNWLYYWKQTTANKLNAPVRYIGNERSRVFVDNLQQINIADDAAAASIKVWGSPRGIDCFAWITAHEAKHITQLIFFWPSGYNSLHDGDHDWIPNDMEQTYMPGRMYKFDKPDTFLDFIGYHNRTTRLTRINDLEDICMRSQIGPSYGLDILWTNGTANASDWANPGKNSQKSY
jgi:hypothetical protein